MSFIYLGQPYTDESKSLEIMRFMAASAYVAHCLNQGEFIYSPIVHCHQLSLDHKLPGGFTFWKNYNYAMLRVSSHLRILRLNGWEESKGLTAEIEMAKTLNIPCEYVSPVAKK